MDIISVEEAVELILGYTKEIKETETVGLLDCLGRILAEDMVAEMDNPPFDRSPIDGYACKAQDLQGASAENPVHLQVLEEIDAGMYSYTEVQHGEAVRIMTGAPIPAGCDCCIRQEDTDYGEQQVAIYHQAKEWENYCYAGEDYKKGKVLLQAGTKLGFVEAGILAGMGKEKALVYRLPKIALLTSGDEVVEPGRELAPGKIYNSNLMLMAARFKEFGVNLVQMESVQDDPAAMAEVLKKAAKKADLIVTTGAVSVGKKDIMHESLEMIQAQRVFWKVKAKPGMPTLFSVYQNVPILSLSGNPFGVAVMIEMMARPTLQKMKQDPTLALKRVSGVMAEPFRKPSKGRRLARAIWRDGKFYFSEGLHSNGVLSSMRGCNCLLDIPRGGSPLEVGDKAEAILL